MSDAVIFLIGLLTLILAGLLMFSGNVDLWYILCTDVTTRLRRLLEICA